MQQLTLLELVAVIEHFSDKDYLLKENISNLHQQVEDFLLELELPEQPELKDMSRYVDSILKEYHHLKDTIKIITEYYNEQLTIR